MKRFAGFLLLSLFFANQALAAGAACVMAKYNGQTLDYELVITDDHPVVAQEEAEKKLHDKGYGNYYKDLDIVRAQNVTNLQHAYVIVIRSEFKDSYKRDKSVMGCGFSAKSFDDALWDALRDAQAYYWGWKPDRDGYKIVRKLRY